MIPPLPVARATRIRNYGLINNFRKFCELMSARLKRRSRLRRAFLPSTLLHSRPRLGPARLGISLMATLPLPCVATRESRRVISRAILRFIVARVCTMCKNQTRALEYAG